jgi:hypothetical protein
MMNRAVFSGIWCRIEWSWVALTVLVMIPVLYATPLVGVGMKDMHAVRHLDEGEFTILRAWKDVYPRGPLYAGPFDELHIYPKTFYNLAGILLYPYGYSQGEDFRMVLIVWRAMNVLFGIGAVWMLFVLVRRVFKSDVAAFIAATLFATTPDFLAWTTNVRPNPFEQLLIFATLFFCVLLTEGFSYRYFLLASLTGALAFASKYGGVVFLVLVPGFCLYLIWRRNGERDQLAAVVYRQVQVLRAAFPFLFVAVGTVLVMFVWVFYRSQWDGVSLFLSLSNSAFPPDFVPKVVGKLSHWRLFVNAVPWGLLVGLVIVTAALAALRRWSRWMSADSVRPCVSVYAFLLVMFMIQTAGIYAAIFFITGPAYIVNPSHFVSQVGFMIYYSGLGGSYGDRPLPTLLEALRNTAAEMPAWWLFAPLAAYAVFMQLRDRNLSAVDYDRRLVLWSYVLASIAVFLVTRVVVVRHVLPAIGLLYGFVGYAVVRAIGDSRRWRLSGAFSAALVVLLAGYAGVNVSAAVERWETKWQSGSDIGFAVGDWLKQQYPLNTRILTDHWTFYTPPEFKNVSTTTFAEWKGKSRSEKEDCVRQLIQTFKPEVVIVTRDKTHPKPVELEKLLSADPALRFQRYHLIKSFESQRRGDRLRSVQVYAIGERAVSFREGPNASESSSQRQRRG